MGMRTVGSAEISPDGKAVLHTVRQWEPAAKDQGQASESKEGDAKAAEKNLPKMEARSHVFRVSTSGGDARQLTFGERSETNPRWSRDGKFISFLSARGGSDRGAGDEGPKAQIWIMPADGGEPWQLTNAKDGVTDYDWSPDSKVIAYTAREALSKENDEKRKRRDDERVFEGDFRMTHLWTIEVASKKEKRLTEGMTFTIGGTPTWSHDGKKLAFMAAPTPMVRDDRRDIYVVTPTVRTGENRRRPRRKPCRRGRRTGRRSPTSPIPAGPPTGDGVTLGASGTVTSMRMT
jgi:Tol biopolymer transport system component